MIKLIRQGVYRLIETRQNNKILYLDGDAFVWLAPSHIGRMLISSVNPHKTDCVLSYGRYRLYKVEDEAYLSDLLHLELEYGPELWQGYILLNGLPSKTNHKRRIIPTIELISNNPRFKVGKKLQKLIANN